MHTRMEIRAWRCTMRGWLSVCNRGWSLRRAGSRSVLVTALLVACAQTVSAQIGAGSRNMLWAVVHGLCVPAEKLVGTPTPCLRVDVSAGDDRGYAVVPVPHVAGELLLVPTAKISGIEDPALLAADAPDYWAAAWRQRDLLAKRLGRPIGRGDIALAVNSLHARTQDQLHIHIGCVAAGVKARLAAREPLAGGAWSPLKLGRLRLTYLVRWVDGDGLDGVDPFRLLADEVPGARGAMGEYALVVVGAAAGGKPGFFVLAHKANPIFHDYAQGEELLDKACRAVPR